MAILSDILRIVVAWIDGVSIIIIRKLYELILTLSNLILTSDNVIKILGQRIGLILGIFMLFRIAITLINYLISPDKASDSSKGGGKLITSILVSLVLLASVNYIFNAAYKLQIAVVNSNIIEKIFFGSAGTTNSSNSNKINSDIDISYYLYSSFFTPNNDISELSVCDKIWDLSTEFVGQKCDKVLQDLIETNARESIINARNNMDMSQVYFNYSLVLAMKNANHNVFDYIPVLSTAIGVMAILILIGFCMDLATRAVKMLFLQIVAPIPIIYNMDPGKGKDVFQKWYKECFNTYLSVFLRLIAINFAVFMIALVYSEFSNVLNKNPLINALIIIGCLMFAKQVPKLLEDMLGIKMGGMVLNPIKKFQDQALFGKNITGLAAAGLAGGAAFGTNMYAAAKDFHATKGEGFKKRFVPFLNMFGSSIAGASSATARGTIGALKGDKFGQIYSNSYGNAMLARTNRDDRQDLNISPIDVLSENAKRKMHISNDASRFESELKHLDEYTTAGKAAKTEGETEVDKNADRIYVNGTNLGAMRDYYEQLKNGGPSMSDSIESIRTQLKGRNVQRTGETNEAYNARIEGLLSSTANQAAIRREYEKAAMAHSDATAKAHADYFKARKTATNALISNASKLHKASINIAGDIVTGFDAIYTDPDASNSKITSSIHTMQAVNEAYDLNNVPNIYNISESIGKAEDRQNEIQSDDSYRRAQLISQQASKEKH